MIYKIDKSREEVLNSFFKDFFSWKADNIGYWILAAMAELEAVCVMCIPFQNLNKKNIWWISLLLIVGGVIEYINPYIYYRDERKNRRIYDTIKYLPVSSEELKLYRLKKRVIFCLKMFAIFFVGQIISSLICFHQISLSNLLYPIVGGLLFPLVMSGLYVWTVK